ncbi:non-specific phospholipase C1 [Tanacetum coccineum]
MEIEFNYINASDPGSKKAFVSNDAVFVDSDPGHSIQAIYEQIFGSTPSNGLNGSYPKVAPMNGFVQQANSMGVDGLDKTVMSGFDPVLLPSYTELVNEFGVFDKWFASVPASTQPNRFYVHSATSHGASSGEPQWEEMAFLITYDEHGGFYDHVATPLNNVPNPDGLIGPEPYYFGFDRLGVRVPTLLISPWIEKGTDSQYEHSSIPATVKKLFNLDSDFLTKRDAWAGTFESCFNIRDTPRDDCPEKLPEITASLRQRGPNEDMKLTEFQIELIQLASQLNGDHTLNSYPYIGKYMTVGEAHKYAHDAVTRFLEAGRAALKAGANESAIVTMKSALSSRSLQSHIE